MKTISYIIGYRGSNIEDRRLTNLILTLKLLVTIKSHIKQLNINLNIIIIEQDTSPQIKEICIDNNDLNYLFIYNSGFYNRGWGFNVGYKEFGADYYFFADGDILLNIEDLIDVFVSCFYYEAVNPYKHIYDSTEQYVTSVSFNPLKLNDDFKLFTERTNTCFSGGIMGISENSMNSIRGWDERFRGRGWEDYAFSAKCSLFLYSMHTYPYLALHLWHPFELNTTKTINEKLNYEYEQYGFKDYVSQIENTIVYGSPVKYASIRQNDTIRCLSKYVISNKRYCYAKKQYYHLYNKYNNNNKKLIYLHLCDQLHQSNYTCMKESGTKNLCSPLICLG